MGSALLLVSSMVTIVDGDVSFDTNEGSGIRLLDSSSIVFKRNSKSFLHQEQGNQ